MKIRFRVCYRSIKLFFSREKAFGCVSSYTRNRQPNFLENNFANINYLMRNTIRNLTSQTSVRSRTAFCPSSTSPPNRFRYFILYSRDAPTD